MLAIDSSQSDEYLAYDFLHHHSQYYYALELGLFHPIGDLILLWHVLFYLWVPYFSWCQNSSLQM